MDYCFTIDKFSGPLDLLLHLIKQSNIDIYDIKIEEIANQYLDYIKKMEELNLNIASSYLVMAAELIEMKASMLLPKPEVDEDDYEDDPKERLISSKAFFSPSRSSMAYISLLRILYNGCNFP